MSATYFFATKIGSQSYQTLISSFFQFLLLSLAISKYRQYFLMLQTLKLNNKKWKKSLFYKEKSLVGLTPEDEKICNVPRHWFKGKGLFAMISFLFRADPRMERAVECACGAFIIFPGVNFTNIL
jgi:hypothetical protein